MAICCLTRRRKGHISRSSDRNKRRLLVTIHHRDTESLKQDIKGTFAAYHWGLLVSSKDGLQHQAFDVTNGVKIDPDTRQNLNSNADWYHRSKPVNPSHCCSLIGSAVIGKIPHTVSEAKLANTLGAIALPGKGEICTDWTWRAIQALQQTGAVAPFDVEALKTWLLAYANQAFEEKKPGNIKKYPHAKEQLPRKPSH